MRSDTEGLIDTHCHLDMSQFDEDREDVIQRARAAGFEALITVGSDLESSRKAIALASSHDLVYATVGIHPHDAKDFSEAALGELRNLASQDKVVAIGETGLDYHYDHSPRDVQRRVMEEHIELAKSLGLPAIVHSREADADTMKILKASGVSSGVMHCFSGDMKMAEEAMEMGLYISVAGPVTFKKSDILKEVAASVPDDYLLVETDAPYLTPQPLRGKRNEPSYLEYTVREVASLRGISPRDVARITSLNAKRLFRIGRLPDEGTVAYAIRDSLYLNITNRCTNSCSFCIRMHSDFVKGHRLRLGHEPSARELTEAIGDPSAYREIVFCGYGEPLVRLDVVKEVAAWVKGRGGRVRINTNGHGSLIHGRNIIPELAGLVDALSISLDAHDEETYNNICRPSIEGAFKGMLDFAREAAAHVPDVTLTVVEMPGVDIDASRRLAEGLGVKLRIRKLDVVG